MHKLSLSIAIGRYDRILPIAQGDVGIEGVNPIFLYLEPEEIFFRAFRNAEFDICELSLSSYSIQTASDACAYVGVPVFPSRAFRHTAIYVRTDRISEPAQLRGCRVGIPEYQLTANVWARALLEDQYGVRPSDITWVQGGVEQPGRHEKIDLALPADVRIEAAPAGSTLSALLLSGDIDAIIAPRTPSAVAHSNGLVGWLFREPVKAAMEYFKATGIFPIMHVLGIRRDLVATHPWLPVAVSKSFTRAKEIAVTRLGESAAASKVTLPFVEERLLEARAVMGQDYWPYGLEPNRHTLDTFLHHHYKQGLSARRLVPEDLFAASSLEAFKI